MKKNLLFLAGLACSSVLMLGCPMGGSVRVFTPTLTAAQLPTDTPGLLKVTDEEMNKRTALGMANALVAVDKILAAEPKNFEAAWRGARACAFLTEEFPTEKAPRGKYADRGVNYAKIAQTTDAARVEGHYWYGINLGQLATTTTEGRGMVPKVVEAGKEAAKIDEKYDFAGPLRLLGSVYAKAPEPPVSVGDRDEGVRTLDRAVQLFPGHPQNVLHLGDALLADDKLNDAEKRYNQVLNAPSDPAWASRLDYWKKEAQAGLKRVSRKRDELKSGGNSPF